jgi:hypothetical protein
MQSSSYAYHTPPPNILGRYARRTMDSLALPNYCMVFFFLRSELTFLPSASTAPLLFLKHILQIRNASLQINLLVGTVVCLHPGVVVLDKDCACLLSSMANPICESIQTKKHFPHSQGSQPFFRIHWGGGSFKSVHSFPMA